jgi:hypothetical protein
MGETCENTKKMFDDIEAGEMLENIIVKSWKMNDLEADFTSVQKCLMSILNTGNLQGVNIDNLLLSIKRSHSNALRAKNEELLTFLQKEFIEVLSAGDSPLSSLAK